MCVHVHKDAPPVAVLSECGEWRAQMGAPGVTRGTYLRLFIISPGAFVYVRVCIYLCSLKLRLNKYTDGTGIKITFPSWQQRAVQGVWHFHLSLITLNVFIRARSPISLSRRAVSLTKRKQALRATRAKVFSKNRYNVIKRAGASFHPATVTPNTRLCWRRHRMGHFSNTVDLFLLWFCYFSTEE